MQLEETLMRQLAGTRDLSKSADRKEFPGGRRTLSRIIWSLKALNPDLYNFRNTEELSHIFIERGFMDSNFAKKFKGAFLGHPENTTNIEFLSLAKDITDWFDNHLTPHVKERLKQESAGELSTAADIAINPESNSDELAKVYSLTKQIEIEHKKWILLWPLSTNVNTPKEILIDIFNTYKFSYPYKHIIRNMFGNHSFQIENVDLTGLSFDSVTLDTYRKRATKYKELLGD